MHTFILAAILAAQSEASCITHLPSGEYEEPATYKELKSCQSRERAALVESLFTKKVGKDQTAALKTLDARHRKEEADYSRRHPDRVKLALAPEAPAVAAPVKPAAAPPAAAKPAEKPADDDLGPEMAAAQKASISSGETELSAEMREMLASPKKKR